MQISRREFLQTLAAAAASGHSLNLAAKTSNRFKPIPADMYELPPYGDVTFMHITDVHAQLIPIHFREPSHNIGVGQAKDKPPHIIGNEFLNYFGVEKNSAAAHAFTHLNFSEAARHYGKLGGYAHLATLMKKIRAQRPASLLLDGGDSWQGSATSLWTQAQDMVDANKLLGVDVMTGHWEFTYGAERVKEIVNNDLKDHMDFVAHNVVETDFEDPVFKPYTIRELNGVQVAVIGQAFPYTPIANPRYMIPKWSFGIRDEECQKIVDKVRSLGASVVIVLSHNGMDVDIKMASRLTGVDAIMGGHTHDAIPKPIEVTNKSGKTLVVNSGCAGKFISVLDFKVTKNRVTGYQFKLLPVFSNLIEPDHEMDEYITHLREPYLKKLNEELAVTNDLLYRRGTFNGSFDQLILDAMLETQDAEIALSPGFRWGMSVLPGEQISFEDVMTQTAITYPITTVTTMTGDRIKEVLEDVADNIFNTDPYKQQGGDMVRVGGMQYAIKINEKIGRRIQDMTLNGQPMVASKKYKVAGWASVSQPLEGIPIWDTVSNYLRDKKIVSISDLNTPRIMS